MSKYNRTKLLPKGLQFIQGVVRGNTRFEITGASFGVTQVTDSDVINNGRLPNIIGNIPIVSIDKDRLADQNVLGIELSFTQQSTKINNDLDLWAVQINGRQERNKQEYPIAYTIAQEPERLTLSDPNFEFRLMVYVQVGDTDKVTINVNQDGMESRAEHARDFNRLIKSISEGYIDVDLKDHNGNQVYDSQGRIIKVKHAIVDTDKSLSILNRAADAKKVGEILGAIDSQLRSLDQLLHTNHSTALDLQDVKKIAAANADINNRQDGQINGLFSQLRSLDQLLHTNYSTTSDLQDVKKIAAANADINNRQDEQINGLITRTNDIESGVINNTRAIRILSHDGKSLATHANATITAQREYIKIDNTLSDYGAVANAGKVGEILGAIDSQLRTLDQLLHTNYSTALDLQDVKNIAAANADINNRQDGQINGLITRTNDIESGVINNTRAIRILSHDGKSLATHANATITARTEYIKTDNTLSDYGAVANAGKVGEAIKQTFLILNASLNKLAADYNSLQSNQVIVDLTNQVLALKAQNDVANHTIQELKKSVEISSAESQKDNLDALHDSGRYYLGNAMGYSNAVLEVATLGNTNKVMQYIFDAGNTQNRTQRRIGTKSGNSYSWSEWNNEY